MLASIGNDPGMVAFTSAIVSIGAMAVTIGLVRKKLVRSHLGALIATWSVTTGLLVLPLLVIEPQPIPEYQRTHIWSRFEISELERRTEANECLRYEIEDEELIWTFCDQR